MLSKVPSKLSKSFTQAARLSSKCKAEQCRCQVEECRCQVEGCQCPFLSKQCLFLLSSSQCQFLSRQCLSLRMRNSSKQCLSTNHKLMLSPSFHPTSTLCHKASIQAAILSLSIVPWASSPTFRQARLLTRLSARSRWLHQSLNLSQQSMLNHLCQNKPYIPTRQILLPPIWVRRLSKCLYRPEVC